MRATEARDANGKLTGSVASPTHPNCDDVSDETDKLKLHAAEAGGIRIELAFLARKLNSPRD
jgi:hypothetical protein